MMMALSRLPERCRLKNGDAAESVNAHSTMEVRVRLSKSTSHVCEALHSVRAKRKHSPLISLGSQPSLRREAHEPSMAGEDGREMAQLPRGEGQTS